jgi:hypothetical protein
MKGIFGSDDLSASNTTLTHGNIFNSTTFPSSHPSFPSTIQGTPHSEPVIKIPPSDDSRRYFFQTPKCVRGVFRDRSNKRKNAWSTISLYHFSFVGCRRNIVFNDRCEWCPHNQKKSAPSPKSGRNTFLRRRAVISDSDGVKASQRLIISTNFCMFLRTHWTGCAGPKRRCVGFSGSNIFGSVPLASP